MCDRSDKLALVGALALLPGLALAANVSVTGGGMTVDLARESWAATNFGAVYAAPYDGTAQPAPGMYLEEFVPQANFGSLLPSQWNAFNLVPGLGEIPSSDLHFGINGASVSNGVGHHNQATTFSFDPADPTSSASGAIGLDGTMKFRGNFQQTPGQSMFLLGEFSFYFDGARAKHGASGWVLKGNISPAMPVFDLLNVSTALHGNLWTLTGDLRFSPEVAGAFFAGPDDGTRLLGTVRLDVTTTTPVPLPGSAWMLAGALCGLGRLGRSRRA